MAFDFSIIIPVYNRPAELAELLHSLAQQTSSGSFEVLVIDDGSEQKCEEVAKKFEDRLTIRYFFKPNSGPGLSRNYGCDRATSDFFVFLDSDCLLPKHYAAALLANLHKQDAFGGPDKAHSSFTPIQKAISYAMTSVLTTGGIRGSKKSVEKFHPRSFNMGITRQVYEQTGGFSDMRFGEDIDLSIRIMAKGFRTSLINECYVFHKRRTDFRKFFKQVFNSGIARINLFRRHPASLKLLHFFPAAFVVYQLLAVPHAIYHRDMLVLIPTILYLVTILLHAIKMTKNPWIALLSVWASMVQLFGYGLGFIKAFIQRVIFRKQEFHHFEKTFYD